MARKNKNINNQIKDFALYYEKMSHELRSDMVTLIELVKIKYGNIDKDVNNKLAELERKYNL